MMVKVYVKPSRDTLQRVAKEVSLSPSQLWDQCLRFAFGNMDGMPPEQVREIMIQTYGPRPDEMN